MARKAQPDFAARRRRLTRELSRKRLDALLVSSPTNVAWLTGFTGEDSVVLVGAEWTTLVTDGRFTEQAERECPDVLAHRRGGPMAAAIAAALNGRKVRCLGFEARQMTVWSRDAVARAIGGRSLCATDDLVEHAREVKDQAEVAAIRKAVRIAQRAFKELTAQGAGYWIGRSEQQIAAELEYRMRILGAEGASFPIIVAAGAHGSLPHYRPGGAKIRCDQAVLIDWGARVGGYCSDLTRVVFTGRIPPQIGRIYEVVLRSQVAGIEAVKAGRAGKTVDAAARAVIAGAGFADQFGHGLGHGLGLEVHEAPRVSPMGDKRLRKHAVVTVEPGIYLPGVGGVRIEDDVLVESDRGVVLSSLPKSLQAMVLK